jgi:hypothetical protein
MYRSNSEPHRFCARRHGIASYVRAGGAFGTSPGAPGTNSSGTALSSSGVANGPMKGSLLGTNPAIDREEAKVNKMVKSICRGMLIGPSDMRNRPLMLTD